MARTNYASSNDKLGGVSRRAFLKTAGLAGAGIGTAALAEGRPVRAEGLEVHVFPDDPSTAGDAIQRAVDEGGTVFVHGRWEIDQLIQSRRIEVGRWGNDVEIIGVDDAEIVGGLWTFLAVGAVRWAIRNLRITGACGTAIGMRTSSNLTVEGCRITGMVTQDLGSRKWAIPVCIAPAPGAPLAPPVLFYGAGTGFGLPEEVSGNILIRNNIIDADVPLPIGNNIGVLIARSRASCVVSGNTIDNAWFSSIMVIESPGGCRIEDNTLRPSAGFYSVGIWLVAWAVYPVGDAFVSRNRVSCGADSMMGIGYGNFVDWEDGSHPGARHPVVVISNNDIEINDCTTGMAVLHGVTNNTVWAQNRISGAGVVGILLWNSRGWGPTGNVFQANNLARLDLPAGGAHLVLQSHASGNAFIGFSGSIIDQGTDNTITGGDVEERPMNGDLEGVLKEARDRLNELRSVDG